MAPRTGSSDGMRWRVSGVPSRPLQDVFPRLMSASWTATIAVAFAAYAGACLLFAGLFALDRSGVEGATSFVDLLWFSVQTLSTIGYGGMTPITPWANLLVLVESFIGLSGVAVVTAILYAKFSLPAARVRFSSILTLHDRNGVPTLHLRMLNEHTSPILDVNLHVGVLVAESDGDHTFRRMHDLVLVRQRIPLFVMAFTVMHTLDEDSPLHTVLDDPERMGFLLVTMRGVDDRTLQPVFARALFRHEQLVFGQAFADMVETDAEGVVDIDADKLNATEPRQLTR